MTRTPLMAGNWKMNLNHQEAVVLVQKLAWTLADKKHDYGQVEVVGGPAVHGPALGADARRRRPAAGAATAPRTSRSTTPAPTPARSPRRCWPSSAAPTSSSATPSAASTTARPTRSSTPRPTRRVDAGMTPIVCVGEGLEVRQAGEHVPHTLAQVDGSLAGFSAAQVAELVVAYEPVWAIGTGEVATPDDAQEVCAAIRERVRRGPRRRGGRRRTRSCTAARSRPRTSRGSWTRTTSTVRWWAARACRPTSSAASAASTTCRSCDRRRVT